MYILKKNKNFKLLAHSFARDFQVAYVHPRYLIYLCAKIQ